MNSTLYRVKLTKICADGALKPIIIPSKIRPKYNMDLWEAKPINKNPTLYGMEININVRLLPKYVRQGPANKLPTKEAKGGILPAIQINFIIINNKWAHYWWSHQLTDPWNVRIGKFHSLRLDQWRHSRTGPGSHHAHDHEGQGCWGCSSHLQDGHDKI